MGYSPSEIQIETIFRAGLATSLRTGIQQRADLFRQIMHVASNQMIAGGVKKDRKAPRVSKSDQVGLARKEIHRQSLKLSNLLSCRLRRLYSPALGRLEYYTSSISYCQSNLTPGGDEHAVQTKCDILYRFRWKSAMRQSTICGRGERR